MKNIRKCIRFMINNIIFKVVLIGFVQYICKINEIFITMSWYDDCINDLDNVLDDCDIEYYEPEDDNRRAYITIEYNGDGSLYDYYDDIEEIADDYGLEMQDFCSNSVDLINMD